MSSIRRPRHLSPGRAARLAGAAVIFVDNRGANAPPSAPVKRVYLHMATQPISRRFVGRVVLCLGLPLLLVSLQTWLNGSSLRMAAAGHNAVFGIAFATFVLGVQTLCFQHVLHPWLALAGVGVPTVWHALVSVLREYRVWAISQAVYFPLQVLPYVLFSAATFIYCHCSLRRGADVIEAVPGAENTPLLICGFSLDRMPVMLVLLFGLGPLLWVWYTFYTTLLEVTQNVMWQQLLVMLVKGAVDISIEAVYSRVSRLVPNIFYPTMFYFYAVKCSFHLLGLRSFSSVVSLVTSEAVLVSNVVLYLLFLVPSVPQRVGRLLPWWEISPEHICCYLGTTLLAKRPHYGRGFSTKVVGQRTVP